MEASIGVTEVDYHWNVDELHAYPDRMVGQKLWPNPNPTVSDGIVCAYCQSPFDPEGCYQAGSCGGQFHPQCFIRNMIGRRHYLHCRSSYHPRLYLQFGLWGYMPTHLEYNPDNFPFDLYEFDSENVEWSWKYNYSKVQLWSKNADGDWTRSVVQITYAANEMYPNMPSDYGLKRFFYQTLGWHWSEDRALRRGNQPLYYVSCGDLARTTTKLNLNDNFLPGHSLEEELEYEDGYYQHRLQMNAIDAILHRVSSETKA